MALPRFHAGCPWAGDSASLSCSVTSEIGSLCAVACFSLPLELLPPRDITPRTHWPMAPRLSESRAHAPLIALGPWAEPRTRWALCPLPPLGLWDPVASYCPPSSCPSCFQTLPDPPCLGTAAQSPGTAWDGLLNTSQVAHCWAQTPWLPLQADCVGCSNKVSQTAELYSLTVWSPESQTEGPQGCMPSGGACVVYVFTRPPSEDSSHWIRALPTLV